MSSLPANTGPNDPNILDWYNDALIALDELYEAAMSGSGAAREKLRSLADNLIEAAGLYGREMRRGHAA
jgi:hypothetical protein